MIRENWNLNNYQMQARKFAVYPERANITYPALGLAGEAGEVADKVKKILRDDKFDRDAIAKEIGDVLWYIAALCRDLNVDMAQVAHDNLAKLRDRQERGKLQGSGDNR